MTTVVSARLTLAILVSALLLLLALDERLTVDLAAAGREASRSGGGGVHAVDEDGRAAGETAAVPAAPDVNQAEDEAVRHNLDLIRDRPRNLRLVFLGDSVTRYQYLSLVYFLRHGRWFDHRVSERNNLVHAHSFHHPLHPHEDWNEFFLQSNRMLYPMEVCDCLRSWDGEVLVERRYFYDRDHNNMAVYVNMNGNERNRGRGYYGRLKPEGIFGSDFDRLVGLPFGMSANDLEDPMLASSSEYWEFSTWGDLIREHIGRLNLDYYDDVGANAGLRKPFAQQFYKPHVLLNAGLHPHDFLDPLAEEDIRLALLEAHLPGTWKTTTFTREEVVAYQTCNQDPELRMSDYNMCETLGGCFNVSWTVEMKAEELYYDNLHFSEPVYRILNEEFLEQLGLLPKSYRKFNRSEVLRDGGV